MAGSKSALWTRNLLVRALPYAAVAVLVWAQFQISADPVVAFPFYLVVVLLVALRRERGEAIVLAVVAAVASLASPSTNTNQLVPALLLAQVLLVVAVATSEVTRSSRLAASAAQRNLDELEATDRRLRAMLESTDVGIALAGLDGAWLQVNERIAEMLGRSAEELMRTTLP